MRSGRLGSILLAAFGTALAALIFVEGLQAGLFPQLSRRYPVGDPGAGNPLDQFREGPKCLTAGDLNGDGIADVIAGNLDGSVSILLANGSEGMIDQAYYRAGGSIRSVAAADLDGDGSLDVAAADITEGIVLLRGNGDGSLSLLGKIPIGPARSIALADTNGDGAQDLLVALSPPDCEQGTPGNRMLCTLLGKGDGTFKAPAVIAAGTIGCLYDVAFADLNGDGFVDALALDYSNRQILIYAGTGDGTFIDLIPGPEIMMPEKGARAFAVAYLDERLLDGSPPAGATLDIVVANRDQASLQLFFGEGGFRFRGPVTIPSGDSPRAVAAGDLNGDGLAELVVTNRNANTISVLRGLGEGRFAAPLEIAAGTSPRELVLADLTGDGALDCAVANRISGDISIFIGRRGLAGFLVPEDYYPAGITPVGVEAEDFDEDGRPDAATVNLRSHDVRIRLNIGNGKLGDESVYPVNFQPTSFAAGDVNGDGHVDLVVSCMGSSRSSESLKEGSVVTLLGKGDGTFTSVVSGLGEGMPRPYWIRLGDLSGDGVLDAAVGGRNGELVVFRGKGDGQFDTLRLLPSNGVHGSPLTMTLGDFNSDGKLDIATSRGSVLLNDGRFFDAGWSGQVLDFPVGRGDWVVESADLDRDGARDLIVALTFVQPDPIAVHFGNGDGTFFDPTIYEAGMGVVSIQTADMDGDGGLDIVCGNRCTADVTILKGIGNRKFEWLDTIRTYSVEGIDVADLNGDGKLDILGAGLALWVVLNGGTSELGDPKEANPAGILPAEGTYINEIMAWNETYFVNEEGKTPDWVEIYNHRSEATNLSAGWVLRQYNRDGQASDWRFPPGTTIGPLGHLVVFCDGGGGGQGLHASFALNSDGESIALIGYEGSGIYDRVDFPAMPKDVSYARFLDGARYLCYNSNPTLGTANGRPVNMSPSVSVRNPFRRADGRIGITARTFDDIGLAYAAVRYKVEGTSDLKEILLSDDGLSGDRAAGDGLFGAILPDLAPGSRILYYLRVVDLDGEVAMAPGDPNVEDLFTITVPPGEPGLRLSELVADNRTDLEGSDWIEITNCGTGIQPLDGIALTKSYFALQDAWVFPRGYSLKPEERLVVICDNEPGRGPLHATFRLDRDGDNVLLVKTDTWQLLDSFAFGSLGPDTSFGIPSCGSEPVVLEGPTPGGPNRGPGVPFLRGDPNADGDIDIADAIGVLLYLFLDGARPTCLKTADLNDTGTLDLTDPVYLLNYLFLAGPEIPEPAGRCGVDPTPDVLGCESYSPDC